MNPATEAAEPRPTRDSWGRLARILLTVFGTVLLAAGASLYVAANLDHIPPLGRLSLVALLLLGSAAAGAWLGVESLPGRAATLLAGLLLGPLLAVYGQTYQTGADAWELFATWAALLLPFCAIARFSGLWLAPLAVADTSIALSFKAHDLDESGRAACLAVLALHTVALAIYEWRSRAAGRAFPRVVAASGAAAATLPVLGVIFDSSSAPPAASSLLAFAGATLGLLFAYRRIPDLFMLATAGGAVSTVLAAAFSRLVFESKAEAGGLFLLGGFILSEMAALAMLLRRVGKRRLPERESPSPAPAREGCRASEAPAERSPWFTRALVGSGVLMGATLVGGALVASGFFEDMAMRLAGGVLLFTGAAILRRRLRGFIATEAAILGIVSGESLLCWAFGDRVRGAWSLPLVLVALQGIALAAVPDAGVRLLASAAGTISTAALAHALGVPGGVEGTALLGLILVLVATVERARLSTAPFGSLTSPVAHGLAGGVLSVVAIGALEGAGRTWMQAPHVLAIGAFLLFALVARTAAVEAGPGSLARPTLIAIAAAGAVAALAHSAPGILVALLLVTLGHLRGERVFVGAGIAALACSLFAFYRSIDAPLAGRAVIASGAGAVLVAARIAAFPRSATRPAAFQPRRGAVPLALATALALATTGALVAGKELVLAHGKRVLLELRPVDPRSLMQGDFMDLRYRIADEARPAITRDRGRLIVTLDARGVGRLERIDDGRPLGPGECAIGYRRAKRRGGWGDLEVSIGAESYFFPEGRAAAFSGARYGELRVHGGGESVLVGLCGKELEPLGRR